MFKAKETTLTKVKINSNVSISDTLALLDDTLVGMGAVLLVDWLIRDDLAAGHMISLFQRYEASTEGFSTAAWLFFPSRTIFAEQNPCNDRFFKK